MNAETLVALELLHALQHRRSKQRATPAGNQQNGPSVRVPAHQQLARRLHMIARQLPTRGETFDWLGRRLITWGWQLRTRHGLPRR